MTKILRSYPLPAEMIARMDALSKETGIPRAEIVRRAIVEYLERKEVAGERPQQARGQRKNRNGH